VSGWTIAWLVWGVLFVIVEAPAVWRKRRGDTLSEQVWWLRDRKIGPIPLGYLILGPFWAWLTLHFFLG
jgi:uncharacterized RDD family membrane protein YckC